MTTITGQNPFPFFTDVNGKALENGNIYIGVAGLDAKTNPITVYFDDAKTITAAQPIRTVEGYPVNGGSPSNFFTGGDFSITIEDKTDVLVYSKLRMNSNELALFSVGTVYKTVALLLASTEVSRGVGAIWKVDGPDGDFSYQEPAFGSGDLQNSAPTPVEFLVVPGAATSTDGPFGTIGDGIADDTSALQAALNSGPCTLRRGATYLVTAVIDVTAKLDGSWSTILGQVRQTENDVSIENLTIVSPDAVFALFLAGSTVTPVTYERVSLTNVTTSFASGIATGQSIGIMAINILDLRIDKCIIKHGLQMVGCLNYSLTNTKFDGLFVNEIELVHASLKSTGIIDSCLFIDSLDNYIDLFTSGEKTVITNNRFLGCKTRTGSCVEIKVTLTDDANGSSAANGFVEQIIISGNYFGNTQAFSAQFTNIISVFYLDSRAVPSFTWAETPRNIIISDNIFDGFDNTLHGSALFQGIYLNTVNAVNISDNVFRDLPVGNDASACIWLEKVRDVTVNGNRCSIGVGSGITFHDVCENLTVNGNHILEDLNKAQMPAYGIRITKEGSRPDPLLTNCKFTNNSAIASISAFRQLRFVAGGMFDCIIDNNIFQQESTIAKMQRCIVSNNIFEVTATRNTAVILGDFNEISEFNIITSNQVRTPVGTPKTGFSIVKMRASTISNNTVHTATDGMLVVGSSTAGELDFLNIKDNFSVSQTVAAFPRYSGMAAGDTASLQAINNQKVT